MIGGQQESFSLVSSYSADFDLPLIDMSDCYLVKTPQKQLSNKLSIKLCPHWPSVSCGQRVYKSVGNTIIYVGSQTKWFEGFDFG